MNDRPPSSMRRAAALALGDLLVFAFFAVQGRATHQLPPGDTLILTFAAAAAPFAAPWFVIAGLSGVYRSATLARPKRLLALTAIAWIAACAAGLAVRSLILQRPILPAFALTVLGINMALLLAWHALFAFLTKGPGRRAHVG